MKLKMKTKNDYRVRRHFRVRHKVRGTAERPRLCVFRSNRFVYLQMIDDDSGTTVVSGSTQEAGKNTAKTLDVCEALARKVAKEAKEKGIESAVFDRGGFRFGSRFKAIVEAARDEGLKI